MTFRHCSKSQQFEPGLTHYLVCMHWTWTKIIDARYTLDYFLDSFVFGLWLEIYPHRRRVSLMRSRTRTPVLQGQHANHFNSCKVIKPSEIVFFFFPLLCSITRRTGVILFHCSVAEIKWSYWNEMISSENKARSGRGNWCEIKCDVQSAVEEQVVTICGPRRERGQ